MQPYLIASFLFWFVYNTYPGGRGTTIDKSDTGFTFAHLTFAQLNCAKIQNCIWLANCHAMFAQLVYRLAI